MAACLPTLHSACAVLAATTATAAVAQAQPALTGAQPAAQFLQGREMKPNSLLPPCLRLSLACSTSARLLSLLPLRQLLVSMGGSLGAAGLLGRRKLGPPLLCSPEAEAKLEPSGAAGAEGRGAAGGAAARGREGALRRRCPGCSRAGAARRGGCCEVLSPWLPRSPLAMLALSVSSEGVGAALGA
jgi:hypothetical protein